MRQDEERGERATYTARPGKHTNYTVRLMVIGRQLPESISDSELQVYALSSARYFSSSIYLSVSLLVRSRCSRNVKHFFNQSSKFTEFILPNPPVYVCALKKDINLTSPYFIEKSLSGAERRILNRNCSTT